MLRIAVFRKDIIDCGQPIIVRFILIVILIWCVITFISVFLRSILIVLVVLIVLFVLIVISTGAHVGIEPVLPGLTFIIGWHDPHWLHRSLAVGHSTPRVVIVVSIVPCPIVVWHGHSRRQKSLRPVEELI